MALVWILGLGLICISVVDWRRQLIPDSILMTLAIIALADALLPQGIGIGEAAIGAVSTGSLFYGIAILGKVLFKREAMGGGDIKMGAMLGAFLGWQAGLFLLPLSALFGLAYVAITWALRRKFQDTRSIPFGPFLASSGFVLILYGNALIEYYVQLMF
ncbi:MAG: A24 family peptidase [Candidatus Zixiibacteriota bacterium]